MNEPHHQQHELGPEPAPADLAAGHEVSDVSIRGLVTFLVGLVVSLAVVVLAVASMFVLLVQRATEADPPESPLAELRDTDPPAPHLQQSPAFDMHVLRDEQTTALKRTRWIDKEAQVVQIPVERAMQLVAERGLPDWPPADVKQSPDKDKEQSSPADDAQGTSKNADAKSGDAVQAKQPSDVSPLKTGKGKKAAEDQS
jgi:hypothetical protein